MCPARGHLVHNFGPGIPAALDAGYYTGKRTAVNGVESDTLQACKSLSVALPIDR